MATNQTDTTNVIKKAVALAERIPLTKIEKLSGQLAHISTQVKRGSALLNNLLGIEETLRPIVERSLAVLERKQMELQNCVTLGAKYHLLSTEPLTWRDKNGWPRLIVFNLGSPKYEIDVVYLVDHSNRQKECVISQKAQFTPQMCRIEHESDTQTTIKYDLRTLPETIASCYADVLTKLKDIAMKREKSLKFSSCFDRLIPEEVKRKIAEARALFQEIFIVAEPKKFQITENDIITFLPPPQKLSSDPLVVGFDGSQLWLIADFDTTSVEEAMFLTLPRRE